MINCVFCDGKGWVWSVLTYITVMKLDGSIELLFDEAGTSVKIECQACKATGQVKEKFGRGKER